jgi:hypothetical protein
MTMWNISDDGRSKNGSVHLPPSTRLHAWRMSELPLNMI